MSELFTNNIDEISCANIVADIVEESYGIVKYSTKNGLTFLTSILPNCLLKKRGIVVKKTENGFNINIYLIIDNGVNPQVVSKNLCDHINFRLKKFHDTNSDGIKIHVKGIRFRNR